MRNSFAVSGGLSRVLPGNSQIGAKLVSGHTDFGDIFRSNWNPLLLELKDVILDSALDLPVGFGGDTGQLVQAKVTLAELGVLCDQAVRVHAADAGILFAELVPRDAGVFERAGVSHFFGIGRLSGGGVAGDDGKRLLATDPGGGFDKIFVISHSRYVRKRGRPE